MKKLLFVVCGCMFLVKNTNTLVSLNPNMLNTIKNFSENEPDNHVISPQFVWLLTPDVSTLLSR